MPEILLIEDEAAIRRVLSKILTEENKSYKVTEAQDGLEGMTLLKDNDYDLVLCDIKMPRMDGEEVLEAAMKIKPETPFIMISGHGDLDTAVNTMRLGAFDYISKPPDLNRLLNTVRNALDRNTLVVENKRLKKKVSRNYQMVGESELIVIIKNIIEKVAPTDARVLITGGNGTGKELVAHWLHEKSNRAKAPFIEVNCAAIPSELIESELFGHVKGSFTGANKDRAGKFEAANGGTIFLDEIGDMSLSAQAKVLRALQENKIQRVGSDRDIKVDVRILAATNKNLKQEIQDKKFREDLYHRLAVILINVPSLNDRRDDIPLLIKHFAKKIAKEQGVPAKSFSNDAVELLKKYDWTGNIRELRNVVERLIILGNNEVSQEDVQSFASKS
ncbi:MAG: sigma-54 dependent transcriptional regulator [Nonlabens sp.]